MVLHAAEELMSGLWRGKVFYISTNLPSLKILSSIYILILGKIRGLSFSDDSKTP